MPFIASLDGSTVTPVEVDGDASVECPKCGDDMYVRERHTRTGGEDDIWVARHFAHVNSEDCGGESDIHLQMKSTAASRARDTWPDATVTLEDAVGDRRADTLVEFAEPRNPFGHGVAIEVQHNNDQKDVETVTQDYLHSGYSVLWLSADDYSHGFMSVDWTADDIVSVWPNAVPEPGRWRVREWELRDTDVQMLSAWEYPIDATVPVDAFEDELREAWTSGRDASVHERAEELVHDHVYETDPGALKERIADIAESSADEDVRKTAVAVLNQRLSELQTAEAVRDDIARADMTELEDIQSRVVSMSSDDLRRDLIAEIFDQRDRLEDGDTPSVAGYRRGFESVECEHCGAELSTPPVHNGETKRSRRCGDCGEWNTLYSKEGDTNRVAA